ncbi:MAG TPA: glycosyltransferase, partial [Pyrinomonadaceae bacterium]|nr:glycosyltransferase [Pyrinomonadaceae bacterium]
MLDQITPLILTYNEAPNIGRTLKSVNWAKDIVIVDSFSDDNTLEIAASFPSVRVFQRTFDSHRNQWQFGLKETGVATPWVLAL